MAKYIVVKEYNTEWGTMDMVPFVFPEYIGHVAMVRRLGLSKEDVLSAGFVSIDGDKVTCHGRSDTLDLSVGKRDETILARLLSS